MDINVIKTIQWSDCKEILLSLARKCLGKLSKEKPDDFAAFISAYPAVDRQRMVAFLNQVITRNELKDITNIAVVSEDSCLFSYEADYPTALDIISSGLRILNTGGVLPSLWCFLDCDQKAVVHFVNRSGWCAEAYFLCQEEFSALHLVRLNDEMLFIPVVFCKDFTLLPEQPPQVEDAFLRQEAFLRQYLPRDLYGFLSKKGKKQKKQIPCSKEKRQIRYKNDELL